MNRIGNNSNDTRGYPGRAVMYTYAIILDKVSSKAWDNVKSNWPENPHIADDRLAFVSSDRTTMTGDVSRNVGIGSDPDTAGIVVQMDYYAGSTFGKTVEWRSKNS